MNNPAIEHEAVLATLAPLVKYATFQLEEGEQGTPHYQGFVWFAKQKSLSAVTKILTETHWSQMYKKGTPHKAANYCQKAEGRLDGPWTTGVMPEYESGTRTDLDAFARNALKMTDRELFEESPGAFLRYHKHVEAVRLKILPPPVDLETRCGTWIYGPTTSGKSQMARSYGQFFDKACNKWWDGYQSEPNIIIDDLDKDHAWMSGNLKRWADRYPFPAETKGGYLKIRPARIIVTSNYHPSEIWPLQRDITDPLMARFVIIATEHDPEYENK